MTDKTNASKETSTDETVEIKINGDSPEPADENGTPETPALSIEESLQQQVKELEDRLVRNVAEFDNYKKRVARQYDTMVNNAKESVIGDFLDVVDNFNRALGDESHSADISAFKDGINLIFNQMKSLLEKYDVKSIDALGKPFDPNFHEALMQVATDNYEAGLVALEINKGYVMGDKVIRHSKVGVSSGPQTEHDDSDNEQSSKETE